MMGSFLGFFVEHKVESILVGLLIATGYGLVQQIRANERARVEAEFAQARFNDQRAVLDSVTAEWVEADSLLAVSISEAEQIRVEREQALAEIERMVEPAETIIASAGASVDATLDSLRISVIPENLPTVNLLGSQINEERSAFRALRDIDLSRIQTQEEIIAAQDSVANLRMAEYEGLWMQYDVTRMTLEEAEAALAAQTGRAEGNWYDTPVNVLKWTALVGSGYALHELLND